ncbi:MAG: aldo/keto reductase [Verrucomicrobiota bacterium JB023]|nr:aldo/keto reductase [Verrucomicrobiota bacterium JB023]
MKAIDFSIDALLRAGLARGMDEARYDGRMPYRRCGRSGLHLPALSLGLWHNFGEVDDLAAGEAMLKHAFESGVTHFDLANNYGPPPGSAELNFGKMLGSVLAGCRDELVIATKAGHQMWPGPYGDWGSRKHLLSSLDQSLKRMKIDYVDIFYSHRPDPETPLEETMGALAHAVQSGKALYVGLSKYPLDRLKEAVEILAAMGVKAVVYQGRYSLLYRGVEGDGILDWLKEEGLGFTGFSPLGQGMLTGKYLEKVDAESRAGREEGFLTGEEVSRNLSIVRELATVANDCGMPLRDLALRWALDHPATTSLIVGARTVSQLEENLAVLQAPPLSEDVTKRLNEIVPPTPTGDSGHG